GKSFLFQFACDHQVRKNANKISRKSVYVFQNITAHKRRYSVAEYPLHAEGNALYSDMKKNFQFVTLHFLCCSVKETTNDVEIGRKSCAAHDLNLMVRRVLTGTFNPRKTAATSAGAADRLLYKATGMKPFGPAQIMNRKSLTYLLSGSQRGRQPT
uniref:Uncharacterized protein n=1 Tax=Romanomermis culicivorax TaxID=13658 RepID=A0A915J7C6_ROMCU